MGINQFQRKKKELKKCIAIQQSMSVANTFSPEKQALHLALPLFQ